MPRSSLPSAKVTVSGMGTSTNCSTTCGSGSEERGGAWRMKSQGTLVAFPAFPSRRERSRIFSISTTESTTCGSLARSRRSAPRCAAKPAPAVQTRQADGLAGSSRRQAHHPRPSDSTRCLPPGEGDASGSSPPNSTSAGPVGLSGVATWPRPQRSTAARVATTSAAVAASDTEQRSPWAAK